AAAGPPVRSTIRPATGRPATSGPVSARDSSPLFARPQNQRNNAGAPDFLSASVLLSGLRTAGKFAVRPIHQTNEESRVSVAGGPRQYNFAAVAQQRSGGLIFTVLGVVLALVGF